jgi:hypothetical protein
MISRARWVSSAVAALLTVASACPAAESGYAPRRGGIGGLIGASQVLADGDYSSVREGAGFGSRDAAGRFAFAGNFRYVITPRWRWQVSPSFLWSAYKHGSPIPFSDPNFPTETTKDNVLTLVLPVSAQIQYTQARGSWIYHAGAGPGVYRVWIENHRKVLKDPISKRLHRGFYPGGSAQIGAERFVKALPSTAIEFSLAGHWIVSDRSGKEWLFWLRRDGGNQFPSGFNSNLVALEGRVGLNYYFDLTRFQKKAKNAGALPGRP